MSLPKPFYEDNHVTLYHGDCLKLLPEIKGGADVLITDPPYGIGWATHRVGATGNADKKRGDYNGQRDEIVSIRNDDSTQVRDAALDEWGKNRPALVFGSLFLPPPEGTRHVAVYKKPKDAGSLTAFGRLRRDLEAIYVLGSRRKEWGEQLVTGRGHKSAPEPTTMRSSLFATAAPVVANPSGLAAKCGHPHAKPGDVLEALITTLVPNPTWTILDPFAGSGSTLVAAKWLGRKAIGIELEERYCEIAAERCSQEVLDLGAAA